MTMDKLENDIRRGIAADQLLKNELVQEANAHIESELWRMFKDVSPSDSQSLEFIKSMQYFHGKYWAFFQQVVTNGKIAQINLEAKKKSLKQRIFG